MLFSFPPVDLAEGYDELRREARRHFAEARERGLFSPATSSWMVYDIGLQPAVRRVGLYRNDMAEALRRPRAFGSRALCRHGRDADGRRAGRRALGRRSAKRAANPAARIGHFARARIARHCSRRAQFRDRHERAGRRLRPLEHPLSGGSRRRRLAARRAQDLDFERPCRRLYDRAVPNRAEGRDAPACRYDAIRGRPPRKGRHDPSHREHARTARIQRSDVRRRLRARQRCPGNAWRGLVSGDGRARFRAQRARTFFERLSAAGRSGRRDRGEWLARAGARHWPTVGAHRRAPGNVDVDRGPARTRASDRDRGRAGQGFLGNALEQQTPQALHDLCATAPRFGGEGYAALLADTMLAAPSFTLRGGTPEVLRGIIAKGLGLR